MIKQHDDFFKRSQAAQVAAGQMQDVPIARSARKPLTVEEIHLTISMIDRGEQGWLIKFARAIEQAHGIGE